MFPNLALDKLLKGLSRAGQLGGSSAGQKSRSRELADAVTDLPLDQLTPLLRVIADKHKRLVMNDRQVSMVVLRDFLALSHQRKNSAIDLLENEIGCIDADVEWVRKQVAALGGSHALDALANQASTAVHAHGGGGASASAGGGGLGLSVTDGAPSAACAMVTHTGGGVDSAAREGSGKDARGDTAGGRPGKGGAAERDKDAQSRSADAAASMVCQMLCTWGIDRGGESASTMNRVNSEPNLRHIQAAKRSGLYGSEEGGGGGSGPGSKRTSMDMMRGSDRPTSAHSTGTPGGHGVGHGVNATGQEHGSGARLGDHGAGSTVSAQGQQQQQRGGRAGGAVGGVSVVGHGLRRCPIGLGSGGQQPATGSRALHTSVPGPQGHAQRHLVCPMNQGLVSIPSGLQGHPRGHMKCPMGQGLTRNPSDESGSGPFRNFSNGSGTGPSGDGAGVHPAVAMTQAAACVGTEHAPVGKESLAALALSETKRRKIVNHFSNLQEIYSKIRCGASADITAQNGTHVGAAVKGRGRGAASAHGTGRPAPPGGRAAARRDLESFSKLVTDFTKYDRLRVVGELQHSDPLNASPSSSIVSSIEFDMHHEV